MRSFCFVMCLSVSAVFAGEDEPLHYSFRYHGSFASPRSLQALAFSPDSRQLAVSISDQVDFIDIQKGEILYKFRASPFSLSYTRDGRRLYMISRDEARLLDVKSGVVVPTHYRPEMGIFGIEFGEHNGKLLIRSLSLGGSAEASKLLKPGDELVAFGEGQNGEMRRITGSSVESVVELMQGFVGTYARVTILPRGKYGANNEQIVVLRRNSTASVDNGVEAPESTIQAESLAWCMVDGRWHEFRDAKSGHPIAHIETIDIENVGLYALSPDQTKFAVVARKKEGKEIAVEVFDLTTQNRLALIPISKTSSYDIAFAGDNNRVLIGTWDTVEIADTAKGTVVSQMTLGYELPRTTDSYRSSGSIAGAAISEVRNQVASGGPSQDRSPKQLLAKLAVSANHVVAVGDMSGNIGLWDLNSGEHLRTITPESDVEVAHLQFSPDGNWVAYYVAGTLHIEEVSGVIDHNEKALESLASAESSATPPVDPSK